MRLFFLCPGRIRTFDPQGSWVIWGRSGGAPGRNAVAEPARPAGGGGGGGEGLGAGGVGSSVKSVWVRTVVAACCLWSLWADGG